MIETVGYMYWSHTDWLTAPVRGYTSNPDWMEAGTEVTPLVRLTDHQAAMREALGLLRDVNFHDTAPFQARLKTFLSAHQECGGGGE